MSYVKKFASGFLWVFVFSFFAACLGYALRLFLARALTPEEYGLFYSVIALIGLFLMFQDLGLSQSLAKHIPEFLQKKKLELVKGSIMSVFFIQLIFGILTTIMVIFLADPLSQYFFQNSAAKSVIIIASISLALSPIETIFLYSFQGFQRMPFFAFATFFRALALFLATFFFIKWHATASSAAYATLAVYVLFPFFYIPMFIKSFPGFFKIKPKVNSKLIKKLVLFGMPVTAGLFAGLLLSYTDTLVITFFSGLKDVALYNVAMPTAKLLWYIPLALQVVLLPFASELWINRKKALAEGVKLLHKYSFIMMIPPALLMISSPELIIRFLFGADYSSASLTLQILAVGGIIYSIGAINSSLLSGIGQPYANTKIVIGVALLNLALNIILVPMIGIVGAAISTVISYLIILILTSLKLKQFMKIKIPWLHWLKSLFIGFVFLFVVIQTKEFLNLNPWAELVITFLIGLIIYTALLLTFRIVDREEIKWLIKIMASKPGKN